MKIYVRKIYPHDTTHEISVTTEIVNDFFDGQTSMTFVGKTSNYSGTVTINAATDPRFGGVIKTLVEKEGGVDVDDLLLIVKKSDKYVLETIKKTDGRYQSFFEMFLGKERHIVFSKDDNLIIELNENDNAYSFDELVEIINSIYDSAQSGDKSNAIRMFGFKYAEAISKLNINPQKIIDSSKIDSNSYGGEITKAINMYNSIKNNEFGIKFVRENLNNQDIDWHNEEPTDEEYNRFKNLIKEFVSQININTGYVEGTKKYAYAGSKASKELFNKYSQYNGFELTCRLASGFQVAQDNANYLNYEWVNLNPHFEKSTKSCVSLFINVKPDMIVKYSGKSYSVSSLGLYDEQPNIVLKDMFCEFRDQIFKWQSGVYSLENEEQLEYDYSASSGNAINKIYYGTPGCGKSYHVDHDVLGKNDSGDYCGEYKEENIIRTTFFQDYSNTDFIGQVMPVITTEVNGEGKEEQIVTYRFVPGPFTIALECAIAHPTEKVALVIEELNRGNAPSIFGDLFQLLDRIDENGKGYPIGTSEYGITNVNIINYLSDNKHYEKKWQYSFNLNEIRLPANLYLFATMNTSDQNVFTLDTAFKRRWEFKKLKNEFSDKHTYADYKIPGMPDITWKKLVNDINDYIVSDVDAIASEDKQIGVYFVAKNMLCLTESECDDEQKKLKFAYKLFEYLWDDVAKFSRPNWFGDVKTLDKLIEKYLTDGIKVFKDGVIKNNQ